MYRKNYSKYKKTSAKKVDIYQEITDKVIEQLESGNAIWKKLGKEHQAYLLM